MNQTEDTNVSTSSEVFEDELIELVAEPVILIEEFTECHYEEPGWATSMLYFKETGGEVGYNVESQGMTYFVQPGKSHLFWFDFQVHETIEFVYPEGVYELSINDLCGLDEGFECPEGTTETGDPSYPCHDNASGPDSNDPETDQSIDLLTSDDATEDRESGAPSDPTEGIDEATNVAEAGVSEAVSEPAPPELPATGTGLAVLPLVAALLLASGVKLIRFRRT